MSGAVLAEPALVKPVLVHLGLPAEPLPVAPARGPPREDVNQSPTFYLTDPAPVTEYEFDQTVSW